MHKYQILRESLRNLGELLIKQDESISAKQREVILVFNSFAKQEQKDFLRLIKGQAIKIKVDEETYSYPLKNVLTIAVIESDISTEMQIECTDLLLDSEEVDEELIAGFHTPLEKALFKGSLPLIKFLVEQKGAGLSCDLYQIIFDLISLNCKYFSYESNIKFECYNYILQKIDLSKFDLEIPEVASMIVKLNEIIKECEKAKQGSPDGEYRKVSEQLIQVLEPLQDYVANNFKCYNDSLQKTDLFSLKVEEAVEIVVKLEEEIKESKKVLEESGQNEDSRKASEQLIQVLEQSQDYIKNQLLDIKEDDIDKFNKASAICMNAVRGCIALKEERLAPSNRLHLAILLDDLKRCEQYIKNNPELLIMCDKSGNFTLQYACIIGNLEIIKLIVKEERSIGGSDKNFDNRSVAAYLAACRRGYLEVVKYFREEKSFHNYTWNYGKARSTQEFPAACYSGNYQLVKYFVEEIGYKADFIIKGDGGVCYSSVIYACRSRNLNILRYLVEEKGANINIKPDFCSVKTPLIEACDREDLRIVEYLIAKGADVNAGNRAGETALIWVCKNGNIEIVKVLLKAGANINALDNKGWSALRYACKNKHPEVVKILLEAGVNIDNSLWRSFINDICLDNINDICLDKDFKTLEALLQTGYITDDMCSFAITRTKNTGDTKMKGLFAQYFPQKFSLVEIEKKVDQSLISERVLVPTSPDSVLQVGNSSYKHNERL